MNSAPLHTAVCEPRRSTSSRAPLLILLHGYGSDEADLLTPELLATDPRPITLLVPDGNWNQARKVALREPDLAGARRVRLPPGGPSRYLLRGHPDPQRVSTFESVARALGIIEGPELQAELEQIFDVFVERSLLTRGKRSLGFHERT